MGSEFVTGFATAMIFIGIPVFAAMIWAYKIYRVVRKMNLSGG